MNTYLTKPVKVFKVCLVKSIPHDFNIHVIQILKKRMKNKKQNGKTIKIRNLNPEIIQKS